AENPSPRTRLGVEGPLSLRSRGPSTPHTYNKRTAIYWPTFTPPEWPGFTPPLTPVLRRGRWAPCSPIALAEGGFRVRPGEHGWHRRPRRYCLRPCAHAPAVAAGAAAYDAGDPHRGCGARHACRPDARAATRRCADPAAAHTSHPIARRPGVQSSPVEHRSKPLQLRRSHPDAQYARRTGSNETAPEAAPAKRASLRRTSPPPAAWSARGCACRPNTLPSGPDTPALLPGSRTSCPSTASSAHG